MKSVEADRDGVTINLTGYFARGNFYGLVIPEGNKYYVSAEKLVGFSSGFKSLHTHIKFSPIYWCLQKHFFTVFEGPGIVLLYSNSPIKALEALEFPPERIVAFNIERRFLAVTPAPQKLASQVFNIFSSEIIWRFLDPGTTLAESHNPDELESDEGSFIWHFIKHILGFLKL